MEIVKKWLTENYGSGYGVDSGSGNGFVDGGGCGFGYGYGSGSGTGYGSGSGYGSGDGFGDDSGYGYGSGYGSDSGYGTGTGSGTGTGYGDGSGDDYKLNDKYIYCVDSTRTIISKIKNNIAKGFIVNADFTMCETFVVKSEDSNYFAHGSSIKEAYESLSHKMITNMNIEDRIQMFLTDYDPTKKYTGKYFFDWHGKLTGSCIQGREVFVKNNNIDLDSEMTLEDFILLTLNEYSGEIIQELKNKLLLD